MRAPAEKVADNYTLLVDGLAGCLLAGWLAGLLVGRLRGPGPFPFANPEWGRVKNRSATHWNSENNKWQIRTLRFCPFSRPALCTFVIC